MLIVFVSFEVRRVVVGALRACATSRSTWAQGLGGGFDAPHAAYVSTSTEGSGVGKPSEPPVAGTRSKPVSVSRFKYLCIKLF